MLSGGKYFISGVDEADAVLVVARHVDATGQRLLPSLMIVPTDAPGFTYQPIEMDIVSPEKQFTLFFDDVRAARRRPGRLAPTPASAQLFAGLNPERIMAASFSTGLARYALDRATDYVRTTRRCGTRRSAPTRALAHPLAQCAIQLELARLMTQKAAALYDAGLDKDAGEAANMAKYAAAEAAAATVDQAIQSHGGNGLASEYGLGALLGASRLGRIAPVSREMILNYVAQHTLKLPKSY